MNPDDKLDALSERIRQASAKPAVEQSPASLGRVGFDFVGSVGGSGLIGAGLDHWLGTGPWCLVGMIIIGFAVGMYSIWRSMSEPAEKTKTE